MTRKSHYITFACLAALLTAATVGCSTAEVKSTNTAAIVAVKAPVRVYSPFAETTEAAMETEAETTAETEAEVEYTSLGEYKLTAYCACEKCCGAWARNRPTDEDGKPIVYTASMAVAKQGVTVAADTDVLPFGTVILIDGHEYTVQDRGGGVKGNHIDVFFDSHEEARQFGLQFKEIFLKGGQN